MGNLTRNFSIEEFYVSRSFPEISKKMKKTRIDQFKLFYLTNLILEPIRSHINKPIVINSGKRSKELNQLVGGVQTSEHRFRLYDCACDFEFLNADKIDYFKAYEFAMVHLKHAISQCIIYFYDTKEVKFIHIGLANLNHRAHFLVKHENGPYEIFRGIWPNK